MTLNKPKYFYCLTSMNKYTDSFLDVFIYFHDDLHNHSHIYIKTKHKYRLQILKTNNKDHSPTRNF